MPGYPLRSVSVIVAIHKQHSFNPKRPQLQLKDALYQQQAEQVLNDRTCGRSLCVSN